MNAPQVSVVVPLHQGRPFIGQTLRSLLTQSLAAIEVLVIDDGSSDGGDALCAAIDDPRVRLVRQARQGVAAARNHGMRLARGAFIAFCDQDDVWHPRKLERQLAALARTPDSGLCCTGYRFWHPGADGQHADPAGLLADDAQARLDPALSGWVYHQMLLESCVLTSSALIRRELAAALGDWDTRLDYGEDWDYWLRASRLTRFAFLAAPMVAYRQSARQGSRQPRAENWSERVLQQAIARWGMSGPDGSRPDPRAFRRRRAIDWQGHGAQHLQAGNRSVALRALWRAVRLDPANRAHWQLIARACLPMPVRKPGR
jgi:glycosyltransferase involved in cell wall biosynthesis